MVFPNYKNKHLEEALFFPKDFLKYRKFDTKNFPKKIIITYQSKALNYLKRKYKNKYKIFTIHSNFKVHIIDKMGVGFIKMAGIGSPHAVTMFEEMIGLGARTFINVGTAGGLQHEGVFLCERAIRDEGTSHHYLPPGTYSYPDKALTKKLGKCIKKQSLGYEESTSWTIDAPYRETKAEITKYKKQGVATVEMEASALFAVAKIRKAKIASVFVVSDILGEKWEPKFHHANIIRTQNKLMDAAVECLK